jgi:glycerol kinase
MTSYILAIDQGTTGSTALVMSDQGATLSRENREFRQYFPQPGWVEHDPEEIWESVQEVAREAVRAAGVPPQQIAAVGITNQRETTVMWDRSTGAPLHRAIVWQDRRTAALCSQLRSAGHEAEVSRVTGLVLDPYFSGTKAGWLLDNVPGARGRAEAGEICLGTIDSYLLWRLSGADRVHLTDVTNASRTLLMDLSRLEWSDRMCELMRIPRVALPAIRPSAGVFTTTKGFDCVPEGTPIAGVAGDQHAALFGQACFAEGDVKCTYGTGAFVLVNIGGAPRLSQARLLTTVAWQIGSEVAYALEGSCFVAGAAVQWLRDGLGLISASRDIEALAAQVSSSEGVVFVPALTGLGAPHWDPDARGTITGLTRGSTSAHLARATLEGIAHQVDDLVRAMGQDLGSEPRRLRVDGGAAANDLLMQIQADLSGLAVERPRDLETTARGAAMLAGLGVGVFATAEQATQMIQLDRRFDVSMSGTERAAARQQWSTSVRRALSRDSKSEG